MGTKLAMATPPGFRLRSVVFSHGWYDLPPFEWDERSARLSTAVTLDSSPIDVTLSQRDDRLVVSCSATIPRSRRDALKRIVADVVGLRVDPAPFFAMAGKRFRWANELGLGRFLRGASAFEDVVKMIATTNCSWSLTRLMVGRMVERFGAVAPDGRRAFPTPSALAEQDRDFFRTEVRAGYRAEYFQRLARRAARGAVDVESWPRFTGDAFELAKQMRAERGCGPYVVDNLRRLFGRFDGLGIDSWCRRKFVDLYGEPEGNVDDAIRAKYRRFKQWQGLALWLDLTKGWHVKPNGATSQPVL